MYIYICVYIYIWMSVCVSISIAVSESESKAKASCLRVRVKGKSDKVLHRLWNHAEKQAIFQGQVSICIVGCSLLCFWWWSTPSSNMTNSERINLPTQSEWYPGAAFDVLFFLAALTLWAPLAIGRHATGTGCPGSDQHGNVWRQSKPHDTSARLLDLSHLYSLSHPKNVGPKMRNILTLSCGKPVPVSSQASCRTALTSAANNAVCPCYCSPYVMLSIFTPFWKWPVSTPW